MRCRPRRGVPLDGRVVRGIGRDRPAVGRRPRLPAARATRERPGAVRRARARRVRRRERAVRSRRRVRARTSASTARRWSTPATPPVRARSSCSTAAGRERSPASGGCRTTAASSRSTRPTLQVPQITTRDVDRGDAPHYLLKEITEAPASFRKTLRAKIVERDGLLDVRLPAETLPDGRARRRCARVRSGACS